MIDSFTAKLFETHIDTTVDLHPGVNVFTGESDEGKSGIIRSLKWNTENRPQGDAYRNDLLDPKKDKKKICSVEVNYKNDGIVIRERDNVSQGINHYKINNGKPLRALRTDVPQEVKDITRMKAVNIQGQHPTEQYFLLADKPGKVAKEFNKVAGLTVMDDALFEINKQVRDCNSELKIFNKEVKSREDQLKELDWVDGAERFATKLKEFYSIIEEKEEEHLDLDYTINEISKIDLELSKFNSLDAALLEVKDLEMIASNIQSRNYELHSITDILVDINKTDAALNATLDTHEALKALKSLEKLQRSISQTVSTKWNLDKVIGEVEGSQQKYNLADKEYKKIALMFDGIKENSLCPTCGRGSIK